MPLCLCGNHAKIIAALILVIALAGCGTLETSPTPIPPKAGMWTLRFHGECAGREAETVQVTRFDEAEIAFDDFRLLRDATGQYTGSANFIAPMPVDGREIGYIISYSLKPAADGYSGQQLVIEGGGHGIGCPVRLVQRETAGP